MAGLPRRFRPLLALVVLLGGQAAAEESPATWVQRILDPATIGVTMPEGVVLNRKLSVDTIRFDDPRKHIAVYTTPIARFAEVSEHFTRTLGLKPAITAPGTDLELQVFTLKGGGKYPEKAEGLKIELTRSRWVDASLQITMEIVAPAAPPD